MSRCLHSGRGPARRMRWGRKQSRKPVWRVPPTSIPCGARSWHGNPRLQRRWNLVDRLGDVRGHAISQEFHGWQSMGAQPEQRPWRHATDLYLWPRPCRSPTLSPRLGLWLLRSWALPPLPVGRPTEPRDRKVGRHTFPLNDATRVIAAQRNNQLCRQSSSMGGTRSAICEPIVE